MPDREPRRWYEMVRAEAGDAATIRIFGDIGESWWGDSVSATSFADELDALGRNVRSIELRINSPGGDMFDGVAIYNTLRNHSARKTVYVDGLAASAASVIAMAGDEIVMGTGTQLMIHDASMLVWGNADELRKQAAVGDQLSEGMASIYADRAGGAAATWRAAMQAETWYSGQEAVDAGLADRVVQRESDAEPVDASVAAMLRRSRVAAHYRYMGRASAPAPQTPVRANGAGTEGGHSVEVTDEDFASLRSKLGLEDTAEIGDVLDALDERSEAPAQDDQAEEKVAAKLPTGVLAVDTDTWAQVQADAKLGREAREAQVQARRAAKVDAAITAGKVMPSRRAHWLSQLDADEEGVTAALEALTPVFGTAEIGHDTGEAATASGSVDEVREQPAYKNWKVVG
jgi:ATP-dependent protease ClpP protease subunit